MLNDDIELKVLRIMGSQVHIGVQAPNETAVHRKEVWERIKQERDPDTVGDPDASGIAPD